MAGKNPEKQAGKAALAKAGTTAAKGPAEGGVTDRAAARAARQQANRLEREERRAARQAERAARKTERAAGAGSTPPTTDPTTGPTADAATDPVKSAAADTPSASAEKAAPAIRSKPPARRKTPRDAPVGKAKSTPANAVDARGTPEPAMSDAPPAEAGTARAARPRKSSRKRKAPLRATEFDILIVGQNGRLGVEAVLFAASLRRNAPNWHGRLIVAEPRPEAAWEGVDTTMPAPVHQALAALGAEVLPFAATRFGRAYPHGNKIEALALLSPDRPFMFFDSDTLITGDLTGLPLDFARPAASMRRTATWPEPPPYGPGYGAIWKSLYDRFGLDFDASLDPEQPDEHWERYLYFNAGWFFGADGPEFGRRFAEYATAIRDEPGDALACQSLDPWLDQVALPLVVHALGGGRPGPELAGLDGDVSCHYRNLSLLYAREPEPVLDLIEELAADPHIAPLLAEDEAVQRLIVAGEGRRLLRPLFAADPPPSEQAIRHRLRREGLWFR